MNDVTDFRLEAPMSKKRGRVRRGGWSWGATEGARLRVISLGAGVQSSCLVQMALDREIGPLPDAIIMADTGDESAQTLRHAEYLEQQVALRSNGAVQFIRVSRGERLSDSIRARAAGDITRRFVSAPFYTEGTQRRPRGGQGRRQCTREFKIEPIERMQRQLLGYAPKQRIPRGSCEVWIGISTDEVVRAGAAFAPWVVNRYPLLELRMSRSDCAIWLRSRGYPVPPKSACVFCPYRSDAEWRWLRENDPEGWGQAVEIDQLIRNTPGMRVKEYLHRNRRPLAEIDFSTAEENGQSSFIDHCDGGCGL
jgi:hypothetical protein